MEMDLEQAVEASRSGDTDAYAHVVRMTQHAVYGVVRRIVPDRHEANDVVQETYLRAFKRLHALRDVQAFPGWLRRIAVTTARNHLRDHRVFFVLGDDAPEVPVLDEGETHWSEQQRAALARAVAALTDEERLLCDRFYHGDWSVARLAEAAGTSDAAVKKRLQRLRERIRKEIEMSEREAVKNEKLPEELPQKVAELLARPRLTDLPENPVGNVWAAAKAHLKDYHEIQLPEQVDEAEVNRAFASLGENLVGSGSGSAFRVDDARLLRTEMTLPMLLAAKAEPAHRRLTAAGKVYRTDAESPRHLQVFHQLEMLRIEEGINAWTWIGELVALMRHLLPDCRYRIEPTDYAPCEEAWSLALNRDDEWSEVLGCGVFRREVVEALGHDPKRVSAYGAGMGLERIAMLKYGLDDIRKIADIRVDA